MARTNVNITEKDLKSALKKSTTQTQAGKVLGITQSYVSQLMKQFGIEAEVIGKTTRDERVELPNYTYKQIKAITKQLMKTSIPTVGYDEVDIEIKTKHNILLIPTADWHIGAKWVWYDRLQEDIEFIRDTANVFTGSNGDLMDNINSSPFRSKAREQTLTVQQQKAFAETYVKELKGKMLWFLNGCHDEWSHDNDGFDLAQYLSHKDQFGYFMGHNGFINLTVGDVVYRLYVTHNTNKNSSANDGHGLRWVCREHGGFDVGIKAHNHKPHVEEFIMRKKRRYIVSCGPYKGVDRFGSKKGYSPLKLEIPGIVLSPHKKEVIQNIDYRELVQYL
jgi:hypothetical protein